MGVACCLRRQLAAVLDTSFCVFLMTFEISRTKRMGRDDDFGDVTKMAVFLRSKKHQLFCRSKFLLTIVLSCLIGLAYAKIFENRLVKVF